MESGKQKGKRTIGGGRVCEEEKNQNHRAVEVSVYALWVSVSREVTI